MISPLSADSNRATTTPCLLHHVGIVARDNRQIAEFVHLLDRINAVRFRKNSELLAAWTSAQDVVGPARPGPEPEEEVPVGGGGEGKGEGEGTV